MGEQPQAVQLIVLRPPSGPLELLGVDGVTEAQQVEYLGWGEGNAQPA